MIGPHQSIIWRLASTGQGAAACSTAASDDTSWASRCWSGSLSIRTNMVGTTWVWVTEKRSTAARNSAASKRSVTTAVHPMLCAAMVKRSGAPWYSGAGDRYTDSSDMPRSSTHMMATTDSASSMGTGSWAVSTPLGRPVVPEL